MRSPALMAGASPTSTDSPLPRGCAQDLSGSGSYLVVGPLVIEQQYLPVGDGLCPPPLQRMPRDSSRHAPLHTSLDQLSAHTTEDGTRVAKTFQPVEKGEIR